MSIKNKRVPMADAREARDVGAPPVQFLLFSCNFWQKSCQLKVFTSFSGVGTPLHPVWKILDPPLPRKFFFSNSFFPFSLIVGMFVEHRSYISHFDQHQTHKYSSGWISELGGLRSHVNICIYLNSVWIVGSSAKQYKQITELSGHYNVDSPVLKPTWFYSRVKLWL